MSLFKTVAGGLATGFGAWRIALGLWVLGLLFALPAAVFVGEAIHGYIGSSLAHETLRGPMDLAWLEEFQREVPDSGSLVSPSRLSSAAMLDNLELWFSGELFTQHKGIAALGLFFALFWTLMSGGVLAHVTQSGKADDPTSFLAASSRYFFRFLRLVVPAGLVYYLIFRFGRWLFPWIETATRDVTVEKTVLAYNLAAAVLVVFLLVLVRVTVDYAKISTVVEERRSMFRAALVGLRTVVTHPLRTMGVYLVMGLLGLLLTALYFFLAPGAAGSGPGLIALSLLVGQVYLLLRWVLRISLLSAETRVFKTVRGDSGR